MALNPGEKLRADSEKRLDLFLAEKTLKTRSFIKFQIDKGRVSVNGSVAEKAGARLRVGDEIETRFLEEEPLRLIPTQKELSVLFEDETLLAINKEQGWVVHPASGHRGETLVHYLLHYLQSETEFKSRSSVRPGIVHRLDKGTSGVMVVGKNRLAVERLSRSFKDREVTKEYEAIVWGQMEGEGTFEDSISRHPVDRKRMLGTKTRGRQALTRWKRLESFSDRTWVRLFPETGRTHQLRVHLSQAGFPIVGDPLYGNRKHKALSKNWEHPFLHAAFLKFPHPVTGKEIRIEAPRPQAFEKLLAELRGDRSK